MMRKWIAHLYFFTQWKSLEVFGLCFEKNKDSYLEEELQTHNVPIENGMDSLCHKIRKLLGLSKRCNIIESSRY